MNRLIKFISVLGVIALLCIVYKVQTTQTAVPIAYQVVLQNLLNDRPAVDFITSHNCSTSGNFQLCPSDGVALQVNSHKIIEQVYLYVDGTGGFAVFSGELPYNIAIEDTMGEVEQKLGYPIVPQMPQLGWSPRLPDAGGTPDHIHYWAVYKQFDLTIVYNSPSPEDKNAGIHMIVIHIDLPLPHGRAYLL